jgi:hypothetical protein
MAVGQMILRFVRRGGEDGLVAADRALALMPIWLSPRRQGQDFF